MDKNKIIREELEKMQTKDSKSPCRIKYRGEFLTTSTGKTVDHGVDVETTEKYVNRAADRGCRVSTCSASSFVGDIGYEYLKEADKYWYDLENAPQTTIRRVKKTEKHPTCSNKMILDIETITGPRGLLSLFFARQ
jgi:hypothetical protein